MSDYDSISDEGIQGLYQGALKRLEQAKNAVKVREAAVAEAEADQDEAWAELARWSLELDRRYEERAA